MSRVEFHDVVALGGDLRGAIVSLVRRRHAAGEPVLVRAASPAQANEIDAWLWDAGEDVFLPHAIDIADAAQAPIAIAAAGEGDGRRPCVLNLRDDAVPQDCPLILELIPADEPGRQAARQRWRAYVAAGRSPVKAG